ncbi:MAG: universal stress protein [Siphonobacter sp.]
MKNILIATDFSENAKPAVEWALQLACHTNSTLHILHTYLPVYPMTETVAGPSVMVEWEETYRVSAQERMDKLAVELKTRCPKVETHLELGPLTTVIEELVTDSSIDLVVMGRSESGGWIFELLGSAATQLIDDISVPVLVVPAEVTQFKIERIAYATQLEFDELKVLKEIYQWADDLNASVQLINVQTEREPNINSDEDALEEIRAAFPTRHTMVLQRTAHSVEEGINELVIDTEADLLVTASHHRNLFTQIVNPSNSRKLLLHSHIPTMVFSLGKHEI